MKAHKMTIALTACAALWAQADTVAWWRFADKAAGVVTMESDCFANAANDALFPAHPAVFYTRDAVKSYEPELMPVFTNFASGAESLRLYDPVSGKSRETRTAIRLPWAGDGSKKNGGVWIGNDARLLGQKGDGSGDFTFECFFRTTEAGINRTSAMEGIAGQMGNGQGTWDLMLYSGGLWTRVSCTNAAGTMAYGQFAGSNATVSPNVWHHAAITFSTNGTYCLYLDYKRVAKQTIGTASNGPWYLAPQTATTPIYIGMSTYGNDRGFEGEIAEARISDVCLTAEQMLQFTEPTGDREMGADGLLAWYSFDSKDAFTGFLAENPHLLTGDVFGAGLLSFGDRSGAFDASERESDVVRAAIRSTAGIANGASADLRLGEGESGGPYVRFFDHDALATADFTEEFFFKMDPAHPQSGSSAAIDLFQAQWAKLMLSGDAHTPYLRLFSASGESADGYWNSVNCCDGKWHHVAFVYDKSSTTLRFYLDHVLLWTKQYDLAASGDRLHVLGGATDRRTHQDASCWIDELRVMRRVLEPSEFMDSGRLGPKTLIHVPFDGNMHVRGAGFLVPKVVKNRDTSGFSEPTNTAAAAYETIDYRDGVNEAVPDCGSVNFNGGHIVYNGMTSLLARSNVTIEFFCRLKGVSGARASLVGLTSNADGDIGSDNAKSDGYWRFGMPPNWDDATLRFWFCWTAAGVTSETGIRVSKDYAYVGTSGDLRATDYDDRWHHVAVTIEELGEGDARQTRVTTYWDRRQVDQATKSGVLAAHDVARLSFNWNAPYSYRTLPCDIDEFRISEGALAPTEFLHGPRRGLYLILK